MNIALVTGSAGLIGSESVAFFAEKFDLVIGIDNNLRSYFFGAEASTDWNRKGLEEKFSNYKHYKAGGDGAAHGSVRPRDRHAAQRDGRAPAAFAGRSAQAGNGGAAKPRLGCT